MNLREEIILKFNKIGSKRKNKKIKTTDVSIKRKDKSVELIYDKLENKKINVCHIVSGLKSGGVESVIYNYCKHIDLDKYEMHILYQHEPSLKSLNEFENLSFKMKRIPSKAKHPIKNYIETKRYLRNNHIDIVHCHMTLMNFIPLIAAKRLGIKIRICHSHNSCINAKSKIKGTIENMLKKMCIKYSTDLVACGYDAGKYLYGNHKFEILNNAVDLKKYSFSEYNRNRIRKLHKISLDDIVIAHIGRFSNQKNHLFIINIFAKLVKENPRYKLILIGDGENKEEIERKVKENKIERNVIFTGIIENTYEYYSAIDIFILPSLWEGLPVVALEAQISNLKCFFSNRIDINSKIIETTEFLDLENEEEWVNKIKAVNKNYERKNNFDIYIEKGYDIKRECEKLEKIYMRLEK